MPAAYNPRQDLQPGDPEYEKLKRSIETFGCVELIVFNERTERVVGGHQRLKILQEVGCDETDCVVVDLSEPEEKALNIALNKISGEWDEERLSLLLQELSESADTDVLLTGFDREEIERILNEAIASTEEFMGNLDAGGFNYKEQFGVIVICKDEKEQETVYNSLLEQGYECRVVAT